MAKETEVVITLSQYSARRIVNTMLRACSGEGVDGGTRHNIRMFLDAIHLAEMRDKVEAESGCAQVDTEAQKPPNAVSPSYVVGGTRFGDVIQKHAEQISTQLALAQEHCLLSAIIEAGYDPAPYENAEWRKHIRIEHYPHGKIWYVVNDSVALYRIELDMSDYANIAIRTRKL